MQGTIRVDGIKGVGHAGALKGLFFGGSHVLTTSNKQVPHEEGDFERGGVVSIGDENDLRAAVSYQDTAFKGQAEILHEDMDMHHDEGRNAKFLENAMNSERDVVGQIVANMVKEAHDGV